MKERNERMEENLDMLQKTLSRTNKRTEDLCHDYEEFTSSVRGLSDMESSFKQLLDQFAKGLEQFSNNMKQMTIEDSKWQIEVHDYMTYYHAVKDVLKLRDQKQLDFEELSDYLQSTIEDREKTIRDKRGDIGGVASYITGKLNEVRGADTDKIKREKVLRLDERVRELQDAIDQTHEVSTAFSDQVKKEDVFFNRNKSIEMFDVLQTYTEAKVHFYQDVSLI
jgi:sorting nexin-4